MKKVWWTAIVISTVVGGVVYYRMYMDFREKMESSSSGSITTVVCSTAKIRTVPRFLNTVGTLQAFDSVQLKAEIDGKIKTIAFKEGVPVEEGEILVELDDARAQADLREAEAMYRKAEKEYKPASTLAKQGVVAEVSSSVKKAESEALLARVEHHKVLVEKHKIRAPFAGVAGLRNISVGEYVSPGKDIVKVVNSHPLRLTFKAPEIHISEIMVGQKVELTADGVPGKFVATVLAICPESDTSSHSFEVKAILDSDNMVLKPGMFVRVVMLLNKDAKSIVLPEGAVHRVGNDEVVYKVVNGQTAAVKVETGVRRDGVVEITKGIKDGDVAVVKGYQINHGMAVKVVEIDGVKQSPEQVKEEDISTENSLEAGKKMIGKLIGGLKSS